MAMHPTGMERREWDRLEDSIASLFPYYERVNFFATGGLLPLWRRVVAKAAEPGDYLVELGPGPGGFSKLLPNRNVILIEPSSAILNQLRRNLTSDRYRIVQGMAEHLPLASASQDKVFCAFALRDFMDKKASLGECRRILRPGGELHILEIGRPSHPLEKLLLDGWIHRQVPKLAEFFVPEEIQQNWVENPYASFVQSYEAMPPVEVLAGWVRQAGFDPVAHEGLWGRAVFHLWGVRT